MEEFRTRRDFLAKSMVLGVGVGAAAVPLLSQKTPGKKEGAEEVSPTEDLMREHGALNRVLLIYEEIGHRIMNGKDFDPATLGSAARIIKKFIEEYHEKLEEDHLFPRFEKARKLTDLVATLRTQHAAGRQVTAKILQLANASTLKDDAQKQELLGSLHSFLRMYRPHEAREDTVLFPALHQLVSQNEWDSMGEQFEGIEHQHFGGDGFEMMVDKIAGIEKTLGIYDLNQFTPQKP